MKDLIEIDENGACNLPEWLWKRLLKQSGLRSKKKRKQKKAVKKQFIKLLLKGLEDEY